VNGDDGGYEEKGCCYTANAEKGFECESADIGYECDIGVALEGIAGAALGEPGDQ